jgi:hypothetical protein
MNPGLISRKRFLKGTGSALAARMAAAAHPLWIV